MNNIDTLIHLNHLNGTQLQTKLNGYNMKQLYRHGETMYILLDTKPIHFFCKQIEDEPDMEKVQVYMKWRKSDHVLKSNTHFLFCETIEDAEFELV